MFLYFPKVVNKRKKRFYVLNLFVRLYYYSPLVKETIYTRDSNYYFLVILYYNSHNPWLLAMLVGDDRNCSPTAMSAMCSISDLCSWYIIRTLHQEVYNLKLDSGRKTMGRTATEHKEETTDKSNKLGLSKWPECKKYQGRRGGKHHCLSCT